MLRHISSAHVLAVLALVFAIGTGSAVALKGKNTVDSGDIKQQTIKGADVRDNTLGGADIDESTLVLPAAASKCPAAAPNRAGDLCFTEAQTGAVFETAVSNCYALGLRLPSLGEAAQVVKAVGGTSSTWSSDTDGLRAVEAVRNSDSVVDLDYDAFATANVYRCVITATVD